ncbi:hypothetical protein [Dyella telluris]|uniref:Uncharacterized protein n=1 Tax=Dyella telluris TaxID=2763498 RepID=A0A7G8Q4N8_9GAMM|nr:hypothetical protein [Dyella telluris]QNK01746.1 hypothetical protein H8F01_00770 [Dyella telluris]
MSKLTAQEVLQILPERLKSLIPVTRESFFSNVGELNVHPCIFGHDYDRTLGYMSDWKLEGGAGERIGATIGGTTFSEKVYFVTPAYYEKNKATLTRLETE